MIPAGFDYEVAESVDHALELLRTKEDAKLLAGGHSLIPLMKLRLARPGTLVDIGRLTDLSGVRDGGDHLAIGAMTRHHDLNNDPLAKEHCPLIAYAAGLVGDPQVRHRGTIGGSLAHGDPASDLPTIVLALDAVIVARGAGGERTIDARDFFNGFFDTALAEDEVITEIRVPKVGAAGWSYLKFRQRALDWATVGVAAVVGASNGSIEGARIAFTNMGQTPLRASATEAALAGAPRDAVAAAAEKADEGTDPPSDTWATADFRRHLARVLTARAVEEALSR
ncbi:FAD binding domain-containing protein [Miltoncostaea oceani]|jgi:aerobic carbon-monoxide dehydrogenase medium subunit|uniref:FAD binding domain-containing protein n=1 Tax=Miltoncostaea oceani TaxID=2843216 RepID=UPI001C3D3DBF|nr:xanthine dehydrogenase family protein subunit M [Miltoncostaea oceani]